MTVLVILGKIAVQSVDVKSNFERVQAARHFLAAVRNVKWNIGKLVIKMSARLGVFGWKVFFLPELLLTKNS